MNGDLKRLVENANILSKASINDIDFDRINPAHIGDLEDLKHKLELQLQKINKLLDRHQQHQDDQPNYTSPQARMSQYNPE